MRQLIVEWITNADEIAVDTPQENLNYKHLMIGICELQRDLKRRGIQRDTTVWILGQNDRVETYIALLGAMFYGLRVAILNGRDKNARKAMQEELPAQIMYKIGYDEIEDSEFGEVSIIKEIDWKVDREDAEQYIIIDPVKRSLAIKTSGTSRSSKGGRIVVHNLDTIATSVRATEQVFGFSSSMKWGMSLPLWSIGGVMIIFRCIWVCGTVVAREDWEKTCMDMHTTHLSLVPSQVMRLMERKRDALMRLKSVILVGGSVCPQSVQRFLKRKKYPVYLTYGMTEMASTVGYRAIDDEEEGYQILPYQRVLCDEEGSILTVGGTVCMGVIEEGRWTSIKGGKFYDTGDFGHYQEGRLEVYGRKDDMFICYGTNVNPREIEEEVKEKLGAKAVIAFPIPDEDKGDEVGVLVDLPISIKIPNKQELSEQLKDCLGLWRPKVVYFVERDFIEVVVDLTRRNFYKKYVNGDSKLKYKVKIEF